MGEVLDGAGRGVGGGLVFVHQAPAEADFGQGQVECGPSQWRFVGSIASTQDGDMGYRAEGAAMAMPMNSYRGIPHADSNRFRFRWG
jgi:hypothetical protein